MFRTLPFPGAVRGTCVGPATGELSPRGLGGVASHHGHERAVLLTQRSPKPVIPRAALRRGTARHPQCTTAGVLTGGTEVENAGVSFLASAVSYATFFVFAS